MSCYSGGFVEYLETIPDEWNNRASEGRNFLLITSQNSSLMSSPVGIDGTICNPFTYAVQKAFEGDADGYLSGTKDGTTTYQELVTYLQETTHELDKRAFPQSIGSYEPGDVVFTHSYQPVKLESTRHDPPPFLQPGITISPGFDWTFPYSVLPKDNSGSFYMNTLGDKDSIRCVGVTLYWSLLNPKEKEYDFKTVNELLKLAEKENIRLVFRLKCSVYDRNLGGSSADKYLPYIPEWVVQKHKPPLFYTYNKPPHFIQVAAPWNPGVQEELKKFIMEFGEQNILSNKYVAGLYVHGISSSPGEEFWLDRRYTKYALVAGMTEDNLNSAFKNRIDWWAEIAGNNVQKLAWVHFGTVQRLDYDVSVLNEYALEKGLGWREGGIESYHRLLAPELGQTMNEEGHIWVDWSYPLRNGNRFFGDEAEVYFPSYSRDIQKHCIESSIFRLVQLGMNYVWTSEPCVELSPEMFAWWTKMAGKNPKETPEATCWLREDYANPGEVTIHNFEHLLVQRDYKGFVTKPVQKIHRYPFYTDPKGIDYDYAARSTNIKTNDTGFLFFIDPRFSNSLSSSFMVKVMYLDEKKTNWVLRYGTIDNKIVEQVVIGEGDNQWKTTTFHVKSFSKELLDHKADFSINIKNKQDLTVKFVRVIRY